jgi:hypothetical protein
VLETSNKKQGKREFQAMNTASEIFIDDTTDDSDVDRMFAHLEQCEPPVGMVERIMAAVARLPLPAKQRVSQWQDLELMLADEESISAC